jgi:multidrug efflux pump
MNLPELCIRRPVLATVLNLFIVLIGLIAAERLTVREYPNIDEPVITVQTNFAGASAEIIESQVTQPLEDSLAGIEGINTLTSISRAERSQITLRFKLSRDPDAATNDVRDRVGRVRGRLPDDVDEPVVAKVEADAQPIIWLAFYSNQMSSLEVTDIADRVAKDRLQTLPGVADVRIAGERRYAMRIWLDSRRLAAYQLTPQDVENALRAKNIEVPSGRIESDNREFTVLAETDLRTPEQFQNMILRDVRGYPVRLGDVARVELGAQDERTSVRFNGSTAVGLGVIKQSTANPLDIAQAVRKELPVIAGLLPAGMSVQVANDTTVFISESIASVRMTILEAVVLVILVIFFFLHNFRATLIPLVTIPVSLVGALALMYAFGFSINTLTLLAMVLAIGLVVDDAIVMLENIYRYIEKGLSPREAAIKGSREITFAILAMTITLAAVYAPVAFMEGRTGRLFTEFALALAGAVLVSGFVALTLSPMMCAKLLRPHGATPKGWRQAFSNWVEQRLDRLTQAYGRSLQVALAYRGVVIGVMIGVGVLAAGLFTSLKSELSPTEDRGTIVGLGTAPEGATLEFTDRYAREMEALYKKIPEVERFFMIAGSPQVSQLISFVRLSPWGARERSQMQITAELAPKLANGITGLRAFAVNPPSLGQSARERAIQFVVQDTGSYADLDKTVSRLLAAVKDEPSLAGVDSDLKLNKPQLRVTVSREKASAVGVDVAIIGRTLETMLGGRQVTRFKREGEQYDVIVQVDPSDRRQQTDLTSIYVRGLNGQMVQLANLVTVEETVAPRELNRFNRLRAATITANVGPGYAMGDAVGVLDAKAKEILPATASVDYNGPTREFKESSAGLYITFLLALGFIYLVLAAQFESFRDPFIILLTVPLSMAGALLALFLTGGTLNVYSQIGLITLVGLITKHGILIVEFANQLRETGKALTESVVEAAVLRLRPILMTTAAMVLGSVPLALAHGAGAESRQQIGWVIVGGLLLGTLLTLYVVPVVYTYLARREREI